MSIECLVQKELYFFPNPFQVRGKDFVVSPFRYPGGKFYALKHILPFLLPVDHDEYREPFLGGGNVFFALPKVEFNWLNDLEQDLMETYSVIADRRLSKKLLDLVVSEEASKERHLVVKNMVPKNRLERAFKTYYLNRTSYCGIINKPAWGYKDGKSSPPPNWGKFITMAGEKLQDVKLSSADFEDVIKAPAKGRSVLMYVDPPYFHADQKRAYTKSFATEDHYRLAEVLKETEYLFCLSYDDCPEIRELYNWAEIHSMSWLYNTANCKGSARKEGDELIITNYRITDYPKDFLFN
ncbi:MAG: DNA adenine methylase [Candidatus Omnitrophica bacterium]|nr:DNA adenine methylase [Candidatus Omnitrophota bacterium]